jgi:hypothetical protein
MMKKSTRWCNVKRKCSLGSKDAAGDIIEEEKDAFSLKSHFFLLHPNKVIFVNEVGNNTSQANHGSIGGEKFICTAGGWPQQQKNMKDAHFTILGFTSATGQPHLCSIIFACKELEPMIQSLDPFATWEGKDCDVDKNTGPGKRHPQGLQCHFNGITVPCCYACSESGSIMEELLAEILRYINKLKFLIAVMVPYLFCSLMAMEEDSNFLFWSTSQTNLMSGRMYWCPLWHILLAGG